MNWYLNYFANNDECTAGLYFSLLSIFTETSSTIFTCRFLNISSLFLRRNVHAWSLVFVTELPDLLK